MKSLFYDKNALLRSFQKGSLDADYSEKKRTFAHNIYRCIMSFLNKIFKKKSNVAEQGWRTGGMEDFMTLIRVYYQSVMAAQLGISNLAAFPDLRIFKTTLKVPTVNNKLGLGEKKQCKKLLQEIYGLSDGFFKEIDQSVKTNCRNAQAMQKYLFLFQGFSQELMMLMGNLMKWKYRLPAFLKGTLRNLTAKQISDIMTKDSWSDEGVRKAVLSIRHNAHSLGYSSKWMTEYVFHLVMLAKKEPKPQDVEDKKA